MRESKPSWLVGSPPFEFTSEDGTLTAAEHEMRGQRRLAALKAQRAVVLSPRAQALLDEAIEKQALINKVRSALRRWRKRSKHRPV